MKHVFTLLSFALMSSGLTQVPEYVPTQDLVAWYDFNSNLEELTANGETVEAFDLDYGSDRFNVDQHSLQFNGSSSRAIVDWELVDLNSEYTLQVWALSTNPAKTFQCVMNSVPHTGFGLVYNWGGNGTYSIWGGDGVNPWNICAECMSQVPVEAGEWNHLVYRRGADSLDLWVNGVLATQVSDVTGGEGVVMAKAWVGASSYNNEFFEGRIDDIGVWQRALNEEEILGLFDDYQPTPGCTDPAACNYDFGAVVDDSSCHFNCLFCQDGTVWSEETQGCVVANPSDTDFDGCVGMIDLLDLLSVFGTCAEVPWECGDPLEYQGYDYETVQIGEQCWFAENLRSENYRNGHTIPANLSDAEWQGTTAGAISAIDLDEYGGLYNWHAISDERGLCPSGWIIPSDEDWKVMERELGMSEEDSNAMGRRGTNQGAQVKADYGWGIEGNGTNSSGFSALPGGFRVGDGSGSSDGFGRWWTSTPNGTTRSWHRDLLSEDDKIGRNWDAEVHFGLSARCIQDSE